jgi:glutamate-1-semialdehyde 2,1-aminomutase
MSFTLTNSEKWFTRAKQFLPGGVNSPVRSFKAVGGTPPVIQRGEGVLLFDIDGNRYIDYVGSWGPLILGHAHPEVAETVIAAVRNGTTYGAPTPAELELAELVVEAMPSVEMVRFVNSGTEAAMSAIRLARGFTGRDKIIKFQGCYHGHADMLLAKAGSGVVSFGLPDSQGVPVAVTQHTLTVPYNNLAAVEEIFAQYPNDIAAVMVEPIAGNMGVVLPQPEFLPGLRRLTQQHDTLLIFDEVITGFRVASGGAQALYNVAPDLTCLGKIIGGGFPVGAYGGKKEIMEKLAPLGPVYQAGTLSGNPVAMAAGAATLRILKKPGTYERLEALGKQLAQGFSEAAKKSGAAVYQTRAGSMLCNFFTDQEVVDYASAITSDAKFYSRYFRGMLARGIYLAPSQFEASFVSLAHTEKEIEQTIAAAGEVLAVEQELRQTIPPQIF